MSSKKPGGEKLGSGRKFRARVGKLAAAGAKNPAGLAAYISRKKYGKDRFQALALAGKRREEPPPPPPVTRRTKV